MNRTSIEWTDFTANPLKFVGENGRVVWGCVHASPGCQHCYAETLAKRYGRGGPFNVSTMAKLTPFLDERELRRMLTYKPASGKRCFVGDMTDIFGEWVSDALIDQLFAVFALRPDVTWQVLTKRAARMRRYFSTTGQHFEGATRKDDVAAEGWMHFALLERYGRCLFSDGDFLDRVKVWPLPNVWLGVSCEDKDRLMRVDVLKDIPATIHFVSFEPLLEDLGALILDGIDWVIVGGESGPGARICNVEWVRSISEQCRTAEVPCFVKQLGSAPLNWAKAEPTGNFRINPDTGKHQLEITQPKLRDRKGGDPDEWPLDLRVRQFPGATEFKKRR